MPGKRLCMRSIRDVLRLTWAAGFSSRMIAGSCGIGRTMVREYLLRPGGREDIDLGVCLLKVRRRRIALQIGHIVHRLVARALDLADEDLKGARVEGGGEVAVQLQRRAALEEGQVRRGAGQRHGAGPVARRARRDRPPRQRDEVPVSRLASGAK